VVYNTPPKIITENKLTAIEDVYYSIDYEYEDIDITNVGQSTFKWGVSSDTNWLKIDITTGVLSGTPTNDNVGDFWVNVTISDSIDLDFTNFTLMVINVNDGPTIITDDIETANEDELYEVDYEAFDVDTLIEDLFWTMDTNAMWLKFDSTKALLNGTPENDDVGTYWVNITVSDTEYIDHSNFTLTVVNVNDPPEIITNDTITAIEDELYEVDYDAFDVDNSLNELYWTITSNAQWLEYNLITAIISCTPVNDDVGEYWINITVSDTIDIDFTNFTLTVMNTNDPPKIITEDNKNAKIGELYSINYEAEDIDPLPVTFNWYLESNTSEWLSIDEFTGWLNGTPLKNNVGIYWLNISVTDGNNGWDYHNFTLQVFMNTFQENHVPELSNASMTPPEGYIKTEFIFSIRYHDIDGDLPKFMQLVVDNNTYRMTFVTGEHASNGNYKYSIYLSEGIHEYYFTASDGFGTVRTDNFTTPYIKKENGDGISEDEISKEETSKYKISWYWFYLIIIVVIIFTLIAIIFIIRKRKTTKTLIMKPELIDETSRKEDLPGELENEDDAESLQSKSNDSEEVSSEITIPATPSSIIFQQPPEQELSESQPDELEE
jgi:hypothetical protein